MSLTSADFKQMEEHIENHIKSNIGSWIGSISFTKSSYFNEIELIERIVRVEEELKSQRELMLMGFEQTNRRFEQIDKRFEDMQKYMDKRFEDVNSKFKMMFAFMTLGFTILATMMTVFKFLA